MAFTKLADKVINALFGVTSFNQLKNNIEAIVPIGTILAHFDYDRLTFDTDLFKYCDGSTVNVGGVSEDLPDLSNRYLVGFGTEAGGDIDSAAWAETVVGIAGHEIDISHIHTMPTHIHTMPSHAHNQNYGATQSAASGTACMAAGNEADGAILYNIGGSGSTWYIVNTGVQAVDPGDTNSIDPGDTNSALSATQSVQPRSIRCRFIMRVL